MSPQALCNQYDEAVDKAKEAAYIQSGLKGFVSQATSYAENKSKDYLRKAELEKPVAFGLVCYRVYKTQSISFPYKGNHITIKTDQVNVTIPFDLR